MDRVDEILLYIQKTNPEMTREKLIDELSKSEYAAKSLIKRVTAHSWIQSWVRWHNTNHSINSIISSILQWKYLHMLSNVDIETYSFLDILARFYNSFYKPISAAAYLFRNSSCYQKRATIVIDYVFCPLFACVRYCFISFDYCFHDVTSFIKSRFRILPVRHIYMFRYRIWKNHFSLSL